MKKKIVIPVMIIMVVTLAGTAMARGGFHSGFGNNARFCNNGPAQLFDQLTPEKQQQVKAVFDKYEDKFHAIKSQMWAKRTELNALVDSGKAEKKDITSLVSEMTTLKDKSYKLRNQVSDEIEQATGIAMPGPRFGGYGMNNGKQGRGNHRQNNRNDGGCWN